MTRSKLSLSLSLCAGLMALAVATPSFAADLPRQVYKAPPQPYIIPFSWTGFYVGINGGYGWAKSGLVKFRDRRQHQTQRRARRRHHRLQPANRHLGLGP